MSLDHSRRSLFGRLFVFVALAALIGGCATGGVRGGSSPDAIDTLAVQRWDYLIARQADKAYDLLSPGYRATRTRETYAAAMNVRPINWKKVTFVKKECEVDRCSVFLLVDHTIRLPGLGVAKPQEAFAPLRETWIRSGGRWYYLPNE